MEKNEIRNLIHELGTALNNIVGKIENSAEIQLNKDEAVFSIDAYKKIFEAYKKLKPEQKPVFDKKFKELSEFYGAQYTYLDKTTAIYAYIGLQSLGELDK